MRREAHKQGATAEKRPGFGSQPFQQVEEALRERPLEQILCKVTSPQMNSLAPTSAHACVCITWPQMGKEWHMGSRCQRLPRQRKQGPGRAYLCEFPGQLMSSYL